MAPQYFLTSHISKLFQYLQFSTSCYLGKGTIAIYLELVEKKCSDQYFSRMNDYIELKFDTWVLMTGTQMSPKNI